MFTAGNRKGKSSLTSFGRHRKKEVPMWKYKRRDFCLLCVLCVFVVGSLFAQNVPRSTAQEAKARRSDAVVKVSATADKADAEGKQLVTVTLKIDDKWHTYANKLPKDFPGVPTSVTVNAKTKLEVATVDYPEGKLIKEGD